MKCEVCRRYSPCQFKVLSEYLPEGAEEDHEEPFNSLPPK